MKSYKGISNNFNNKFKLKPRGIWRVDSTKMKKMPGKSNHGINKSRKIKGAKIRKINVLYFDLFVKISIKLIKHV